MNYEEKNGVHNSIIYKLSIIHFFLKLFYVYLL